MKQEELSLVNIYRQDVFVVGDAALVFDNNSKALPTSAYVAEQQGRIVAQNIFALLTDEQEIKLWEYRPEEHGSTFAISIGKDFAVSRAGGLDLFSYSASALKKLIKMKYLKGIAVSYFAVKEFYEF